MLKKTISPFLLLLPLLLSLLLPISVSAQTTIDIRSQFNKLGTYPQALAEPGASSGSVLGIIISRVVTAGILLSAIMVLMYLVWAGVGWLTAGGDKARVEAARDRITNAIIGMAIVASAFAIYKVVDNFFGLGNAAGGGSSATGSAGSAGSGSSTSCGGGLNIGQDGNLGGVNYTCVKAGTLCNGNTFNYPFNCPTTDIGKK